MGAVKQELLLKNEYLTAENRTEGPTCHPDRDCPTVETPAVPNCSDARTRYSLDASAGSPVLGEPSIYLHK